ncbi:MAG: RluA family pseudouridine synthase [Lachnospiraceae bacterium]|nr:RluA family pseudouridine synthase [Lachnospiraceae bacterium]
MQEFQIGANEEGQRLDKFLHKYLKEANTSFLYKMLRKKNITLNKKKADGKEILTKGDLVQFFFSEDTFLKFRGKNTLTSSSFVKEGCMKSNNEKIDFCIKQYDLAYKKLGKIEIIFENEHILLLNKPAGVLSQKANHNDLSINEWLIGYLLTQGKITTEQLETFKPSICNRLDRNTSGLMICGKSFLGSQTMNSLIKDRSVKKYYRTFVKGKISEGNHIRGYLKKDQINNKVSLVNEIKAEQDKEYQFIETAYEPLSYGEGCTYLEVELITGKTHQIRAHLASIGHPLLGDEKYGDRKWNATFTQYDLPKHQLLHSYCLKFPIMEGDFEDISGQKFVAKEPAIFDRVRSK